MTHHKTPLILSCLLVAFVSLTSRAETDEPLDDFIDRPLEELLNIRVSSVASLFEEDELYVGSSVSKVTEKMWRRQGAEKTFDAIEHVPGVYVVDYMYGQSVPTFRGFIGGEQYNSFLVLIDGVPLNNYASSSSTYGTVNFALGNLQSMEVIRGPGSALYGADAFNGVVSLNSWSSDQDTIQGWAEGGAFGYWNSTVRFRQTLTDNISFTGAYTSSGTDDEEVAASFHSSVDGQLVDDEIANKYKNFTATNKLKIDDTEMSFYFSEHHADDGFTIGEVSPLVANGLHSNGAGRMKALKLSNSLDLGNNWQLDSTLFHVEDTFIGRWGDTAGEPVDATSLVFQIENNRQGLNLRFKRPFADSRIQVVVGYNYDLMEVDQFLAMPDPVENEQREMHGFMGQLDARLFDDLLQVIIGGRFDHYTDFGDYFAPRLALIYHPNTSSALKLLYGNAFRSPSVLEKTNNLFVEGGGGELKPEEVDTYELIWQKMAPSWRYSIALYHSEITKEIGFGDPSQPFPPYFVKWDNVGTIKSKGVELEGSYQYRQWSFDGNLAHNDTERTEPDDDDITAYPSIIVNLGVRYQFPDNISAGLNNMYLRDMKTDEGDFSPAYTNEDLPSLMRTDFHLSWKTKMDAKQLELYMNVMDMFDNADVKGDINSVENGKGTRGRKFVIGAQMDF
ncbi:MAG TPA: TonB-dependent receptor [Porticoccus sp.]|nr:TonB-dependent receptor [Porticoccus sp.]